jgi:phospholipase C
VQRIETLVVLMLENRSFDHMLGFLKRLDPTIDGLAGTEWNPSNPLAPGDRVTVSPTAESVLRPDPGHSVTDTNVQLFSRESGPPPLGTPNHGFVWSYSQQKPAPADPARIMACFDPGRLPVLTTLARRFALCDAWFSSVPGPTWPNRFFAHAATSRGYVNNGQFNTYDMETIFERLAAHGQTWRNYYHDFSQAWALRRLQTVESRRGFRSFGSFKSDAHKGTLPNYAFIEPKYFSFFGQANDQHPPHDVRAGERLIAEVYEALRASPQWERTMLLVTYDEHGGTYDHVPPPAATPPDGYTSQFGFDRYGLRVPSIVVSPFVPPGPVHTLFDHSSIPATLAVLFGLPGFLTARDAAANTFHGLASLPAARTDVPDLSRAARQLPARRARRVAPSPAPETKLSDLQEDLVALARTLEKPTAPRRAAARAPFTHPATEPAAALYVRKVAAQMSLPAPTTSTPRRKR